MNDKRWITKNGHRILINNYLSYHPMQPSAITNDLMNKKIKTTKTSTNDAREQISVSYAKQRFKNNIGKYGFGASFEDSILNYNLQKNEIESLYKYAQKTKDYQDKWLKKELDEVYERYKDGIKPYEW